MAKDHPDFSRSRRYRGAKNTSLSSASPTAGAAGEQDGPRTSADVRRADQQSHAHTPRRVGSDSTGAEDSDLQERIGERRKSRRAARHSAASEDEEGGNRRSRTKRSAAAETRKKSDRRPPTSRQVSISPERNGYEPERDPGHGKGSAAVQGDAIRRQTERERAVPLGGGRSARHSRHSSPTGGGRHTSRRQQDHREREREHEHDRDRPRTPFANEEAPLPGSAAAQGDAIRRGEKPTRPSVAYANKGREKTYHAPAGEQNAPAIPRVYPMTGIDNLALLMVSGRSTVAQEGGATSDEWATDDHFSVSHSRIRDSIHRKTKVTIQPVSQSTCSRPFSTSRPSTSSSAC